jgi:hypothetical protein
MPIQTESLNKTLYEMLKVRGYNPKSLDSSGKPVPVPDEADVFKFTFSKDGKDFDNVWVTLEGPRNIVLYYDDDVMDSGSENTSKTGNNDTWLAFVKNLKNWAMRRQLGFELKNGDHLAYDMAQREDMKKQENISEGYYPMGKSASYNDNVPTVKIILQHTRQIQEGEQRYRNVARIFLENTQGERILAPTNKPGIAQVYARHLAEGGVPNDERWNHLKSLCEEYSSMAGFVRAVRGNQFNESAQRLVEEGLNHYQSLRESLGKMRGSRGYNAYFESWTPTLMENEGEETNLNELFVQETLDPRIESVMPILSRLRKNIGEMKEVSALAEWADSIIEDESLTSNNPVGIPEEKEVDEAINMGASRKRLGDVGGPRAAQNLPATPKKELDEFDIDTLNQLASHPMAGTLAAAGGAAIGATIGKGITKANDWYQKRKEEKALDRAAGVKEEEVDEGSSENKYSNLSNRGVDRGINRASDDFTRMMDLDQAESPHYKTQHQQDTKQRLKTKPMAGPKGVLPEQGVAEDSHEEQVARLAAYNERMAGENPPIDLGLREVGNWAKVGHYGDPIKTAWYNIAKYGIRNNKFNDSVDKAMTAIGDFPDKYDLSIPEIDALYSAYETVYDQWEQSHGATNENFINTDAQAVTTEEDAMAEGVLDAIKKGVAGAKQFGQDVKAAGKEAWDEVGPMIKQDWKHPIQAAMAKEGEMDEGAHTQHYDDANKFTGDMDHGDRPPTDWSVDPIEAGTDRIHQKISSMLKKLSKPKDTKELDEAAAPWEDEDEEDKDKKPTDSKGKDGAEHGGHSRAKHLAKNAIPKEKEEVKEGQDDLDTIIRLVRK